MPTIDRLWAALIPSRSDGLRSPDGISFEQLGIDRADEIFDAVLKLLAELVDEAADLGEFDRHRVLRAWRTRPGGIFAVAAHDRNAGLIGIATVCESFAIYANGLYGSIDEMYVAPPFRSKGIGEALVREVVERGRDRGWTRVEVTAPESERWTRTRRFYERQGFVFAGPKFKFLL